MLSRWPGSSILLFVSQIVFLTTALSLIPTFAYWITKRRWILLHVVVESLMFICLFVGFGLTLFGTSIFSTIIIYAIALILLLEIGGHIVEWHLEYTLKRLSNSILFQSSKNPGEVIKKMFRSEQVLYLWVPLGIATGTIIGLLRQQALQTTIVICLQCVLLLEATTLLYFLIYGFGRMCDPIFKTSEAALPEIVEKQSKGRKQRKLSVLVPPKSKEGDQELRDLDLACDVSELRKLYKYDALHSTILLIAYTAVILKTQGIAIDGTWLIGGLLVATLLFSEIPYGIGQYLLHQKVQERYTGSKHAELAKKLADYAPIIPPKNFLIALTATGTAGSFLYLLLNQFIQNALTTILK